MSTLLSYTFIPHVQESTSDAVSVLEVCAVTCTCLDGQVYEELCRHPELRTLEKTGRQVLSESAAAVGVAPDTPIAEDEPGREGGAHNRGTRSLAPALRKYLASVERS